MEQWYWVMNNLASLRILHELKESSTNMEKATDGSSAESSKTEKFNGTPWKGIFVFKNIKRIIFLFYYFFF